METRLTKLILAVLFVCAVCVNATTMDFYTDGEIVDGNVFGTVNIWDGVTVDMYGGVVTALNAKSVSTFNMYNGSVSSILCGNGSLAHLYGGNINTIIHGGEVHIYGYDFVWTLGDPIPQRGVLTGKWEDSTPFSINMRDIMPNDPYVVLHEIPEPATLFVLGLGYFLIKRKNRG